MVGIVEDGRVCVPDEGSASLQWVKLCVYVCWACSDVTKSGRRGQTT